MTAFQMLSPSSPLIGPDGRLAREWYVFFMNLWQSNGGGQNAITQDQLEALLLAGTRIPSTTSIESLLQQLVAVVQAQRDRHDEIDALRRRVAVLEDLLQARREPLPDPSVADLQTITFGSRPWL